MRPLRLFALPLALAGLSLWAAPSISAAQPLHRCKDAAGNTTFSDRACAPLPQREPAGKPEPGVPGKAAVSRLTEESAEQVLRHALRLGEQHDYQGQCALAAPDLAFRLTDHSTHPATVYSGGRGDICALQQQSAQALQQEQLGASIRAGKMAIRVQADGKQASARYETTTTLSQQGRAVLVIRCAREEVLGLYGGRILYARVDATCRPLS